MRREYHRPTAEERRAGHAELAQQERRQRHRKKGPIKLPPKRELELIRQVVHQYQNTPGYGPNRIHALLYVNGVNVTVEQVELVMYGPNL